MLLAITFSLVACSSSGDNGSGDNGGGDVPSPGPIAIWMAATENNPETGGRGDFGFSYCQDKLNDPNHVRGAKVKGAGFTQARFFGSTPDYNLISIIDDLGLDGDQKITFYNSDDTESTSEAKASELLALDIDRNPNSGYFSHAEFNSKWENFIHRLLLQLWSFTKKDGTYDNDNSCGGATSMSATDKGSYHIYIDSATPPGLRYNQTGIGVDCSAMGYSRGAAVACISF